MYQLTLHKNASTVVQPGLGGLGAMLVLGCLGAHSGGRALVDGWGGVTPVNDPTTFFQTANLPRYLQVLLFQTWL